MKKDSDKHIDYKDILDFYKEKRVLVTGNTGFKGAWLSYLLLSAGAEVIGYSLNSDATLSLFNILEMEGQSGLTQIYGDIRDCDEINNAINNNGVEIVFHLAAQPIVRESYKDPVKTYSTNVMGTVNVCEAVRHSCTVHSFLNVTTDKVYRNNEWEWGYREIDVLDGFDPYSNSKSCSELVTSTYKNCFFDERDIRVSTARAGNVIGGGDFSPDRIIPDSVRSLTQDGVIKVRNPFSVRPYQHVLEPLFAYLLIAKSQYEDKKYAGVYNVGPDESDCVTTGDLVNIFCSEWNKKGLYPKSSWKDVNDEEAPHEASFLKLDCSKLKSVFGWHPTWNIEKAVRETINWSYCWMQGQKMLDIRKEMDREIQGFIEREV